jgi:hypothetical protein
MKNTVCEELNKAVGKLALEEGEDWRLSHPELMDSYQVHCEDFAGDAISFELIADAHAEFETRQIKIRCASCEKEVLTTLGELKQKFRRGVWYFTLKKQLKIRIPFTKTSLILSFFHEERAERQDKIFMR